MKLLKKILQKVGEIQARIILSLIFISLVPLFSLIAKLIHKDSNKGWEKWNLSSDSLEDLKKQF